LGASDFCKVRRSRRAFRHAGGTTAGIAHCLTMTTNRRAGSKIREDAMTRLMILILSGGMALAACNTVEGVGRDVQSVGNTIEDVAD
jgi:predicted small secreted protein